MTFQRDKLLSAPFLPEEFEQIYRAAQIKDEDSLSHVTERVSIDIFKQGCFLLTPAAQLAAEGNHEAVEWLIAHTANVNYIGFGYALGGYIHEPQKMLYGKCSSQNYMAYGAVLGGNRCVFEESPYARLDFCVTAAAQCNNEAYVKYLIARGASRKDAIGGAALGSHKTLVEKLLDNIQENLDEAAQYFAFVGDRESAEALLEKGVCLDVIACGAASGSQYEYVDDLIKRRANLFPILCGFAYSGNKRHLATLMPLAVAKKYSAPITIEAVIGGHYNYVMELVGQEPVTSELLKITAFMGHQDLFNALIKDQSMICYGFNFLMNFEHRDFAIELLNRHFTGYSDNYRYAWIADNFDYSDDKLLTLQRLAFLDGNWLNTLINVISGICINSRSAHLAKDLLYEKMYKSEADTNNGEELNNYLREREARSIDLSTLQKARLINYYMFTLGSPFYLARVITNPDNKKKIMLLAMLALNNWEIVCKETPHIQLSQEIWFNILRYCFSEPLTTKEIITLSSLAIASLIKAPILHWMCGLYDSMAFIGKRDERYNTLNGLYKSLEKELSECRIPNYTNLCRKREILAAASKTMASLHIDYDPSDDAEPDGSVMSCLML